VADEHNQANKSLEVGLSFVTGTGLLVMVTAAAIGVISGASIDPGALGLLFAVGVAMLVTGIIVWFAVVRPDTHFDDINEPMYHGHHDEH
jgi:hypothetical protein